MKIRILFLEDNPYDAELAIATLKEELDAEVRLAKSKAEFIAELGKPFDLLIADHSLPSFTGLEAIELARKRWPVCPALIFSGTINNGMIPELLESADDVVIKGFPALLVFRVLRLLKDKKRNSDDLRNQRMESIGKLASGVAHDLNNTLQQPMAAYAMLEKFVPQEQRRILRISQESIVKGVGMVKHLLMFIRGSNGFQKGPIIMAQAVGEFVHFISQTLPSTEVISSVTTRARLYVDPVLLDQVLLNFCHNSNDAHAGTIEITAEDVVLLTPHKPFASDTAVTGTFCKISVKDDGDGMDAETAKRIFEPFYTTKAPEKGTGWGLASVLSIAKDYGGHVDMMSVPGHGSTFSLLLPIPENNSENKPVFDGAGRQVLIVDDELALLDIIQVVLEMHNYVVFTASSGAEAFNLFTANPQIEIVLTDVRMPLMDGPTLIQKIRAVRPEVIVVVMSAAGGLAPDEGEVDAELAKPYTADKLLATLDGLTRK